MNPKKAIKNLEGLMRSYTPFWREWTKNENCSLSIEDQYIVEVHTKNNFKINLFETFMFYNQTKRIEIINAKLMQDGKKFKQWVISNFLFSIVEIAHNNGGRKYLHRPIGVLEMEQELKNCLFRLNIICLSQLFEKYTEEDFERNDLYNAIMEFEVLSRFKQTLMPENKLTTYKCCATN